MHHDERGAGLVEYILLVSVLILAVLGAIGFLTGALESTFSDAGSVVENEGL